MNGLTSACGDREPLHVVHAGGRNDIVEAATDKFGGRVTRAERRDEVLEQLSNADCLVCEPTVVDVAELFETVQNAGSSCPVIVLTASDDEAATAVSEGVAGVVQHGTGVETAALLANRIEATVGRHCAEARLERASYFVRSALNAIEDAYFVFDGDLTMLQWNRTVTEVTGYTDSDVESLSPLDFVKPVDKTAVNEAIEEVFETGQGTLEATIVTRDGREIPYEFTGSLLTEDGEILGIASIGRDISERVEREAKLDALTEATNELLEAGDRPAIYERTVEIARDVLGLPLTTAYDYDGDAELLEPAASTPTAAGTFGTLPTFPADEGLVWKTFRQRDVFVYDDVGAVDGAYNPDTPVRTEIQASIGDYGVLLTGFRTVEAVNDYDRDLVEILATSAEAAIDRVEYERALRRQRTRAEQLNRINEVIRDIDRELVHASTREAIEQAVCDRLAASDAYRFAWVGGQYVPTEEIRPRASAGHQDGYLDNITVRIEDVLALDSGSGTVEPDGITVVQNVAENPQFEPWREQALARGYRSAAAVPLTYRDTLYGVLFVYAARTDAFGDRERAVLEELGETIGHAINGVERKRALLSEGVIELEFRVTASDSVFTEVPNETGCTMSFEGVTMNGDGSLLYFVTVTDSDPETVCEELRRFGAVEGVRVVSERDDAALVEFVHCGDAAVTTIADYGGRLVEGVCSPTETRVTWEIPQTADVRSVVSAYKSRYPAAELVAQRERNRSVRTDSEFRATLDDALTERQRAALETAYRAGFFEWPRASTGGEVADSLGVSAPTFHQHLRVSERKLLDVFFGERRE